MKTLQQGKNEQCCVDVIVPCYNYGRYLTECVESVLHQDGVRVRVLIIDDASSDNTDEVGTYLASQDARVLYRRHATNQGHIETFNEGIDWASSEYLLLLSADDALMPHALSTAVSILNTDREAGFVYGQAIVGPNLIPSIRDASYRSSDYCTVSSGQFLDYCCTNVLNPVPTPAAIVRTELQKLVGGYRRDLPHTGDLELWMRLAARGRVAISKSVFAFYRRHESNMTYLRQYPGVGDLSEYSKAFASVLDTQANRIENLEELRTIAKSSVAWKAFWSGALELERGNLAVSEKCLAFAQTLYPSITTTRSWYRMQWKRFFGAWFFAAIKRLRGESKHVASQLKLMKPKQIGWWPDVAGQACSIDVDTDGVVVAE
jgi:glycosyltransferase involved in cell wall biosynthesis